MVYSLYKDDDAELVERIGYQVNILNGDSTNIKITSKEDLKILNFLQKSLTR